jgi:hypothetical protein
MAEGIEVSALNRQNLIKMENLESVPKLEKEVWKRQK